MSVHPCARIGHMTASTRPYQARSTLQMLQDLDRQSSLQYRSATTCPQAHGHRAALISSVVDAQLSDDVGPPAPEAAATRHSACVKGSRCDGGDGDACRGKGWWC
jgi:hypothetical protein